MDVRTLSLVNDYDMTVKILSDLKNRQINIFNNFEHTFKNDNEVRLIRIFDLLDKDFEFSENEELKAKLQQYRYWKDCSLDELSKKHITSRHQKVLKSKVFSTSFLIYSQYFCVDRFFFILGDLVERYHQHISLLNAYLQNIDFLQEKLLKIKMIDDSEKTLLAFAFLRKATLGYYLL